MKMKNEVRCDNAVIFMLLILKTSPHITETGHFKMM